MTIRVGESGKPIRYNTGVKMTVFTELKLVFTAPAGGTTFTVTDASSPGVSLGAKVVDEDEGVLNADEYLEYTFDNTDFDVAGTWKIQGTYTNTGADPDDIFLGPNKDLVILAADAA